MSWICEYSRTPESAMTCCHSISANSNLGLLLTSFWLWWYSISKNHCSDVGEKAYEDTNLFFYVKFMWIVFSYNVKCQERFFCQTYSSDYLFRRNVNVKRNGIGNRTKLSASTWRLFHMIEMSTKKKVLHLPESIYDFAPFIFFA